MDSDPYRISVRTMDLGLGAFDMIVSPAGVARYGRVEFVAGVPRLPLERFQTGGLNEKGMTCDQQTLVNASYPLSAAAGSLAVTTDSFCGEVLANYGSARELEAAISNGSLAIVEGYVKETHFVARDALGESLVIEAFGRRVETLLDLNDDGVTGFGIFTNEPAIDYHITNVRHFKWKQTLANPSLVVPGDWYPDSRFLRIYLVKNGMDPPGDYTTAVQQAVHVLNTITVPMGSGQLGTDSSLGSGGEGPHDHTLYGVVYDHLDARLYYRTYRNLNLQMVDLPALLAHLETTTTTTTTDPLVLSVLSADLPWYNDATSSFAPLSGR
ncbi:hypothetical protein CTAYLR_002191 [Chrysophaeum taylorii]|uniref:Choloylglycine hydrolase/NAAA C-terminal domain-containing protein n=1 Tax=Chrysophaeum taylorii TaxID=2483200 RepID=A0AAD7XRM4_9STRA|nr:hypothetical protein CTAYLR_002191 [Chrysophaeum taylorii]